MSRCRDQGPGTREPGLESIRRVALRRNSGNCSENGTRDPSESRTHSERTTPHSDGSRVPGPWSLLFFILRDAARRGAWGTAQKNASGAPASTRYPVPSTLVPVRGWLPLPSAEAHHEAVQLRLRSRLIDELEDDLGAAHADLHRADDSVAVEHQQGGQRDHPEVTRYGFVGVEEGRPAARFLGEM